MKYVHIFEKEFLGNRLIQLAEKHNLQHLSEGVGDQRHIIIKKNIAPEHTIRKEPVKIDVEQINVPFRSFSLLEKEEKRESIQKKGQDSQSSQELPIEKPITPEPIEDRVRKQTSSYI